MAITRPMLPPKAGYVEVEVDGLRTYRNVETGELIGEEGATLESRVETLEVDSADTKEALEMILNGVTE